jgi:hypothetical protein
MANPYQRPLINPTTRTYEGAICGADASHGTTRYRSNGCCVMCAKLNAYDRYQDRKRFRESPRVVTFKANAYREHMEALLRALDEAARAARAAKENAPRGAWVKNLRAHGLQPKAIAALRRWLEDKEKLERERAARANRAKDGNTSWMD